MATLAQLHQEIVDHMAMYPTWVKHDRTIEFYARLGEIAWDAAKLAVVKRAWPNVEGECSGPSTCVDHPE